MRLRSLASRLFVVTAVALSPAIAIAVSSVITMQRELTADLHASALRAAELLAREVEQTISGVDSVLRTVAAAPVVRLADTQACSALLAEAAAAVASISALFLLEEDGTIRCQSRSLPDVDFASRDYFAQALGSDSLVTGTWAEAVAPQTAEAHLPVALKIAGRDGAPPGVAVAFLDLVWLEQRLQRRTLPAGGSLTIVDRAGTILARVPDPQSFVGTKVRPDYLHLLDEPRPGSLDVVSQDGTKRILGYFPPAMTSSGLYVSAGYSVEEGFAPMRGLVMQALSLALLGTALASVLAYYTARVFIVRPVGVLIDTVSAWRSGDTAARTVMTGDTDEIGSAGAALDGFMTELLASRAAAQKADEARDLMQDELEHREKNLLATVQAIARQTFGQGGNAEPLRVFSDRLNAISKANRLLKQSGWDSTPLRGLIADSVSTFIGEDRDRIRLRGPDIVVKGNVATAIGMAMHELCTNAVKYGALSNDTGQVTVDWALQPADQGGAFTLVWTEAGGPPVTRPDHTGFGSKVIRHALSAQTGGSVEITHDPGGLVCRLTAPAETVLAPASA